MKVAIVGAGISGLYICKKLKEKYKDIEIHIFERAKKSGGKIRSVCLEEEILEKGAWRISKHHSRMIKLMDVDTTKIPTHTNTKTENKEELFWYPKTVKPKIPKIQQRKQNSDLSVFAARMMEFGIESAAQMDVDSGYMGLDEQPADSSRRHQGRFFGMQQGYNSVVEDLYMSMADDGIVWKCGTIVKDVSCQDARVCVTSVHIETSKEKVEHFDKVIFACSPNQASNCCDKELQMHLRPLKSAIKPLSLCRIYRHINLYDKPEQEEFSDIINPENRRYREIIVNQKWNVFSYTSGKLADAWIAIYNTKYTTDKNYRAYYWPEGTHSWRSFFHSCKALLSRLAVIVTADVFIAGEAISATQGWSEGALQSCDHMLSSFEYFYWKAPKQTKQTNKEWKRGYEKSNPGSKIVFYRNRAIDVSDWVNLHPGGPEIIKGIENFGVDFDISERFDNAHLNDYAFGQLMALQVGVKP